MIATTAAAALLLLVLVSAAAKDKVRASRAWLWVGLIAPMSVGLNRTAEQVETTVVDAGADAIRVAVPVLCLGLGLMLGRPLRKGHHAATAFLALFVLWSLISALWSVNNYATFAKACVLAVEFCLVLALAQRYPDGATMLRAIVGAAHLLLISAALGLLMAPGLALVQIADGTTRLVGVWPAIHPNVMGIIALVALVGLTARVGPRWTLQPQVRLVLVVVAISDLVLARTRLALALTCVMVGFVLLRALRRRTSAALTLLVGGCAAVGSVYLFGPAIQTFLLRGQTDSQLTSLTGRLPLWENALHVWDRQPLVGFGYFSGHRYAVPPVAGSGISSNLDNMWVELLVDVGLIGTALMALAVLLGVVHLVRSQSDPRLRTFTLATGAAFTLATTFNPSLQLVAFIGTFFALLIFAEQPIYVVSEQATSLRRARPVASIRH